MLELVQAVGTFINDCRTEGVLVECDDNEDAHCEREQELDPKEERVSLDEGTVAYDCTDKADKDLVISTEYGAPQIRRDERQAHPKSPKRANTVHTTPAMINPVFTPPSRTSPCWGPNKAI